MPSPPLGAPPPHPVIGVPDAATREFFGDEAQAESFAAALARLTGQGARIVELDFTPFFDVAGMLYEGAWVAERLTVVEALLASDPDALHPVTRSIIGGATRLSAADAYRGFYRLAALKRTAAALLDRVDLLCVPTIPTPVTLAAIAADPIGPNSRLGTYTNFVNLLDLCGIAVPCGPRADGLPGSVTLLAKAGQDMLAASVAERLQHSWRQRSEPCADGPRPMPDEIALAVVGAHMSGLPLNGELTSRGGRFLRAAATAPRYRLHALAGGPPQRPGLARVPDGGASIALEVWALPLTAFGGLMAGVPSPLAIGTLTLADGTSVKGFLCEAEGLVGARDITDHGGWRAWLAAGDTASSGARVAMTAAPDTR